MKRIFLVKLESAVASNSLFPRKVRLAFETVATNAVQAIYRATVQARKECSYRGAYVVVKVKYRGPAV